MQCALFCFLGRCTNTQIEILKHPSPTRKVNVLSSYNKGRAKKTAVSSEAHQQKCARRLLTSPLLFLKTLAKLSNPPIHSHFEISVFLLFHIYYISCWEFGGLNNYINVEIIFHGPRKRVLKGKRFINNLANQFINSLNIVN